MSEEKSEYTLKAFHGLSFSVDSNTSVTVTLLEGKAELFGTELLLQKEYVFQGFIQTMIFSWHDAKLLVIGKTLTAAVRNIFSHMESILSIHSKLELMRNSPRIDEFYGDVSLGPRILICGVPNSGKTVVSRLLASYATRLKHDIIYSDLDIEGGLLSMPGSVAATEISTPISIESEFHYAPTPIMYFVGSTDIKKDEINVYDRAIEKIAERVNRKLIQSSLKKQENSKEKGRMEREDQLHGGVIIDTLSLDGNFSGPTYDAVVRAISLFRVDMIIVNGSEDYFDHFTNKFPNIIVEKLSSFPSVSSRKKSTNNQHKERKFKEYFHGAGSGFKLLPHTLTVKFDQVKFCRVKSRFVPKGSLPLNQDIQTIDKCQVEFIQPGEDFHFLHSIFALSAAHNEEDLTSKNILGFVHVVKINPEKKKIVLLVPIMGGLPSNFLLISRNLTWDGYIK